MRDASPPGESAAPPLSGQDASLASQPDEPIDASNPVPSDHSGWVEPEPVATWRRVLPVAVGIVITVAVVSVGWYFNAGRSSSGEIERAGDLAASELRVGDCFDLKDPGAEEVEDVTALPCAVEHEYEAFFVGVLDEGPYPADPDEAFAAYVEDNCVPAFDAYVGMAYADSELDIFWFYPMEDAWEAGDQSVQCAVFHPRVHRLVGSLRGSTR